MKARMNNPIRLYMSMSLDGYIAGPDDRPGQELGLDGGRLFNWLDDREVVSESNAQDLWIGVGEARERAYLPE